MYTCFESDGRTPRFNRIGLVIFTRTLRGCLAEGAREGDRITGWSSCGHARATYSVTRTARGTLRAVKVAA